MKGQENMKRQKNVFENVYSEKIFEQDKLQSMQDMYCHSCQVYGALIGEGSGKLTSFSGDKEEVKRLGDLLGMEYMYSLISELRCNSLEQQIIADTPYTNIKTAVISIQPNELCRLYGVFVGIMDDIEYSGEHAEEIDAFTYRTTTEKFELSLNFFRSFMEDLFTVKFKAYFANEESHKSKESERQMELELKRNEAMTEIVQMLEDDERFENILKKILKIAGEYLNISDSYIFQVQKKEGILKKTAGWRKEDLQGKVHDDSIPLEWIKDIEGRQIVASFGSPLRNSVKQFFAKYGLKAVICIPITVNDDVVMYAAFLEREQERIWDVSEIKFLNDVIKIIQSILIRRITKDSLASSYDSLTAILDNIGSGIYVVDKQSGEILFTNAILKTTFHNEIKEGTLNQLFEKAIPLNDEGCFFELFYEKKKHWYDLHYTDIVWVDGRKVRLCAIYDITDKKLYQKKIEMQANNDFLTGLYNRMRCETDLQKYIEKAKATGRQGALLYLDLDDFKHINDGLGHQYGDVLLKSISHSFQRIPAIEDTCYRMGGDEFIIIVAPDYYEQLDEIVAKIGEIFDKPWFLKGAEYYCTMSMGIVSFPAEGETVHDLIKKSDIAMYEAKKSGKNRVSYYDEETVGTSYKRLDLEKNMRHATANGCKEFEVYYQPIIDVTKKGNPCIGAEALIRWNSSKLGFITPAEFIPLAEYLGLINPIGNFVLEEALRRCKHWNDVGHPEYKVNVNLSVVQLLQNNIVEVVADMLKKTGVNPANLTLEVTESLAINDMNRMKRILGSMRQLGVKIALDDFGTGYSSLNHIKEIPLDVIKVDQSFVTDIVGDSYAQAFVKMVSELANAIGVRTCVEGVEYEEQYQVLKDLNVHMIQGYYFGKPMKAIDFEAKYL